MSSKQHHIITGDDTITLPLALVNESLETMDRLLAELQGRLRNLTPAIEVATGDEMVAQYWRAYYQSYLKLFEAAWPMNEGKPRKGGIWGVNDAGRELRDAEEKAWIEAQKEKNSRPRQND